jgi:hypothetical protein
MACLTFGEVLEQLRDADYELLVLADEHDGTVHPLDVTVGQLRRDLEALRWKDMCKLFAIKVKTEDVGLVSVNVSSVEIGMASVILGIATEKD